ncbi:MAG: hypothetical protein AAFN70_15300, partial [Planctomycetota bacterium]
MCNNWNLELEQLTVSCVGPLPYDRLWETQWESPSGLYVAIAHSIDEIRMGCHTGHLLIVQGRSQPMVAADFSRLKILVNGQFAQWLTDDLLIVRLHISNNDIPLALLRIDTASYAIIPDSMLFESG